jgi:hypothetical protein
MTKTDTLKKNMIDSLNKSLGIVTNACKAVGISRETHYRWLREDSEYAQQVREIEGVTLDFAESKLHEQIFNGNVASIIFFLKTKGKSRGYIERQEFEVKTDRPDLSSISTEDLMEFFSNEKQDGE